MRGSNSDRIPRIAANEKQVISGVCPRSFPGGGRRGFTLTGALRCTLYWLGLNNHVVKHCLS
jgi:hypothetical protein